MDPVTLVITALSVGAAAGLTKAATDVVAEDIKKAYGALRTRVLALFPSRDAGEAAILKAEQDPTVGAEPLEDVIRSAPRAEIDQIAVLAEEVIEAAGPAGANIGRNVVNARGAKGLQVGDNNWQQNTFN